MRKSTLLLSAAVFTFTVPAFAQDTTDQGSTPAEAPAEAANVDTADQAAEANDEGAIVITATRRSEALSDVPLAVSAVTADTLKNTGAVDIRAVNQVSPSLLVSSTSSEAGGGAARIRGVGTVGDNAGLESSVAVFIDGVYRSRTGTGLTELGPVDRIEVLRGPQGTLFGRNASAGLIHVITAKPKFSPEIYGDVTIGNYDLRRVGAGVTGPVTDSLALRLDGIFMKRDGFMEDVISGNDLNDRNRWLLRGQVLYQPTDSFSLRIIGDYSKKNEQCCAAAYLPISDFVATGPNTGLRTTSAIRRILDGTGSPYPNDPGLGAIINDDTYDRETSVTPGRSYNSDVVDYGISAEATYDFGGAELTSITAYRFNDWERGQDADYNNLDILYRDGSGDGSTRFKTFTQELRLQGSAFNDRLDWLVGGFYMHENLRVKDNLAYGADYSRYANCLVAQNFAALTGQAGLVDTRNATCFNPAVAAAILPGVGPTNGPVLSAFARLGAFADVPMSPFTNSGFTNLSIANGFGPRSFAGVGIDDQFTQKDNNWSVFTHNIFSITERLKLTLGARYTHDKKTLDANLNDNNTLCAFYALAAPALQQIPCVIPSTPGGNYSGSDSKKENKLSGTVVLSWKPIDSILLYGSYSRGYKAGGFNLDRSSLLRSNGNGAIVGGPNALNVLQFDPEINDAYELGMKYKSRGIDVNLAFFRQDFKDFQLNTFNGINFEVANINSCTELDVDGADADNSSRTGTCTGKIRSGVRSEGVELEVFTRPFRDARLNMGVTYAQTKYRNNLVGSSGQPISNALFQLPNRNISNAPEMTVTGAFTWTPQIGSTGLRGLFYFDGRYTSSFNTGSDLDIEKTQKGFEVFNARVGLSGRDDTWSIELWSQNIFNRKYKQIGFDAPLQGSCTERGASQGYCSPVPNRATQLFAAFLGEPRTFGLTLRAKWKPRPAMEEIVAEAPPPPPAPAPETQTCADGSVILATESCPPPPPPPPPAPEPERG